MPDDLSAFRDPRFAEPLTDLEQLLSQNRRAFLLGAGCSFPAGLPLMSQLTDEVVKCDELNEASKAILTAVKGYFEASKTSNIEDYLSEIIDYLAISQRRRERNATHTTIAIGDKTYDAATIVTATDQIKLAIANCIVGKKTTIDLHRQFVRVVHDTLRSGKPPRERHVDYFVLNYDTLMEDALALERKPYSDGFRGGPTGWWDESDFHSSDLAARVYKLHGSIDWCTFDEETLPRRVRQATHVSGSTSRILIWPAATKYQEAQRNPFSQMLLQLREALVPASGSEAVLAICGYSFGDSHVNWEIDRALRLSQRRLTIVVFTNADEPEGQVALWTKDGSVNEQVRVHGNRGFFHAGDIRSSPIYS